MWSRFKLSRPVQTLKVKMPRWVCAWLTQSSGLRPWPRVQPWTWAFSPAQTGAIDFPGLSFSSAAAAAGVGGGGGGFRTDATALDPDNCGRSVAPSLPPPVSRPACRSLAGWTAPLRVHTNSRTLGHYHVWPARPTENTLYWVIRLH